MLFGPHRDRPLLMGILNVTPDSFSDGGVHFDAEVAVRSGVQMVADGADLLDVGGESTRPGAEPVDEAEELRRVLPVVQGLRAAGITVSVDTMKPNVARLALQAGASVINDVTALRNPEMTDVVAQSGAAICLMHMQGDPQTMQKEPRYQSVVSEVRSFLLERAEYAERAGIEKGRIWLDPGIGFGKTTRHNLLLLKHLDGLVEAGYPVLLGVSRKAFIGRILGSNESPLPTDARLEGTLAVQVLAQMKGASIIRAHDVRPARRAIDMVAAVANSD